MRKGQSGAGQQLRNEVAIALEKLEVLDGSRNRKVLARAAVRIEDLNRLFTLPALKSKKVTDVPTQAEYNALQQDVAAIRGALEEIIQVLKKRIAP